MSLFLLWQYLLSCTSIIFFLHIQQFCCHLKVFFVLGLLSTISYLVVSIYFDNLTGVLCLFGCILSGFVQLLRYYSVSLLADTILFLCFLSSPKQGRIFEHPRSCECYLCRADVAVFESFSWWVGVCEVEMELNFPWLFWERLCCSSGLLEAVSKAPTDSNETFVLTQEVFDIRPW